MSQRLAFIFKSGFRRDRGLSTYMARVQDANARYGSAPLRKASGPAPLAMPSTIVIAFGSPPSGIPPIVEPQPGDRPIRSIMDRNPAFCEAGCGAVVMPGVQYCRRCAERLDA